MHKYICKLSSLLSFLIDDGTIKQRIPPLSRSEDGSDSQSDAESFSESYSDLADESLGQDDLLSLAQMADKQAAEGATESDNTLQSSKDGNNTKSGRQSLFASMFLYRKSKEVKILIQIFPAESLVLVLRHVTIYMNYS